MSGLKDRLISGVGANAFGQAITILMQVATIPIFLVYWDVEKYGQWLILSAIPAYFSVADAGILTVAANKMAMASLSGRSNESNVIFQSSLLASLGFMTVVLATLLTIILFADFEYFINIEIKIAFMALTLVALGNVFSGIFDGVFRAADRYSLGVYFVNLSRLVEWLFGLILLPFGGGYIEVACGFLVGRLLSIWLMYVYSIINFNSVRWGFALAKKSEMKSMLKPALAFLSFPVGNALNIQGLTIIVGLALGPVQLALFNTYRTYSRVVVQVSSIFTKTMWPEVSRLFSVGDYEKIIELKNKGVTLIAVISALLGFFLFLFGQSILNIWTHGKISYDSNVLILLILTAIVASVWQLPLVINMAGNRHEKIAVYYLIASLFFAAMSWFLIEIIGFYFFVFTILLFEIFMLLVCFRVTHSCLKDLSCVNQRGVK